MGVLAGLAIVATTAHGHDVSLGDLVLDHPYAVPSLVGVNNGAAHLRGIKNRGEQADRLLGASSPAAARVVLQRLTPEGGVIRTSEVPAVVLPPHSVTLLRHTGDYQLTLMALKRPLKDGDRFDLTLNFERAGIQTVKVWVQTPRVAAGADHPH
jgi:hypothetical protein